jgi:hypothetical protein
MNILSLFRKRNVDFSMAAIDFVPGFTYALVRWILGSGNNKIIGFAKKEIV